MPVLSPPDPDLTLVTRAQTGDRAAFAELVRRYQDRIYGMAYRFLGNPDDARDLAQEAFIRIFQGLKQFRGQSRFSSWAFVVVRNLCFARSRRLARELAILDDPHGALPQGLAASEGGADSDLLMRDTHEGLQAAMMELPEKYRLVLVLHHFQELKYEDVAEVLNLPVGTVKTHLYRAKAALKTILEKRGLV